MPFALKQCKDFAAKLVLEARQTGITEEIVHKMEHCFVLNDVIYYTDGDVHHNGLSDTSDDSTSCTNEPMEYGEVGNQSSSKLQDSSIMEIPVSPKPTPPLVCLGDVVMFIGYVDPQHQKWIKELGAEVTSCATDKMTVLVADGIRRTGKLLCALGRGIPIVSSSWIMRRKSAKILLDPTHHLIEDCETEKKFGFSLRKSLQTASKTPLLQHYKVHATKYRVPSPD